VSFSMRFLGHETVSIGNRVRVGRLSRRGAVGENEKMRVIVHYAQRL